MGMIEDTVMEVGVVATHIPPAKGYGGVSVTAGVLTKAWAELGHEISVVASDESMDRRLKPEDAQLGAQVQVDLYHCYGFRRWGFGLGAIAKLFALCLKAPVVYIHGIATWPCTLAAIFCVLLRRRFMVAAHGGLMPEHVAFIQRRKPHKWLFYKLLTLPTLRRAISVHCTSEAEAEGVRNVLDRDARILLVPNGIDSREINVTTRPAGEGITICFLGHIQPNKGINAFIRAWLRTRRQADRLVAAGRCVEGAYFEEFQELVAEAKGAISYRGYLSREEGIALLANSHFLVFPSGLEETCSMGESFGNAVAEAMASGRPVLVARGLPWDHVESIEAGFIFDRAEPSVCQVLRRVQALSVADWQRMSRNARDYVEQYLDPVNLGDQVWQALTGFSEKDAAMEHRGSLLI